MRTRWIIAAAGALGLALVTIYVPAPWRTAGGPKTPACPVDAKVANLNFTMKDMHGREVTLADYRGKVILLDFWATWCAPCKVEIPWFAEFQQKYGPEGLEVVGISVDDTQEMLVPFVEQFKMNYTVLQGLNHDDIQEAYGPLWGIPVTTLISREGKICSKHTGIGSKEVFESEIKALLRSVI